MRLIDAEAWKLDLLLLHGHNEKTAWIFDRINHAPTVDAIPIEWIKEYIDLQESYDTEWGDISGVTIRELLRYYGEWKEECTK